MKDYLGPTKLEFIKLQDGEPVKIRILPDSPVVTYQKHFKGCPCCEKDNAKGHIRYRSNVIDASDGKIKAFDFGPTLKRELLSVINFRYSYSVVKIGGFVLVLINKAPHVDIVVEKFRGAKPFPEYRVKQI